MPNQLKSQSHRRRLLGGASPAVRLYDTFTEAANTLLQNHTPDIAPAGSAWSILAGTWTVLASEDTLSADSGAGKRGAIIAYTPQNFTLTCTIRPGSDFAGRAAGLYLRYQDATHYVRLRLDAGSDLVALEYENGGGVISLDTAAKSMATFNTYAVSVTILNNLITATVDGGAQVSATTAVAANGGYIGVLAQNYHGATARWDTLDVNSL